MSDIAAKFKERAARHGDDLAVVAPSGSLTYRELASQVDRLAARFTELSPAGSLVALEASSRLAGLLAVLAAGASRRALLPVDLSYPDTRRAAVLRDARPAVVLREDEGRELVATEPAELLAGLPPRTGLDQVAYVMYTSGSTGTPKGVAVSHRALEVRIDGLTQRPGLAEGESMLALTALSFDPSLAELLLPLRVGGTVLATDPEARSDPDLFAEAVERLRPDVVQATPSFWRLVTAAGWRGLPAGRIWSGGEAMTGPLAEVLLSRSKELWNVYGPTETTIWSTAQLVSDSSAVGLGEAVPGTRIHLEPDPHVDPGSLREGETEGEVLLYGPTLAEGYLDRESLTSAHFVDHVVLGEVRRCYRTGDRVRRLADGTLEFLGRVDQQVKIRGHRVELGDVEAAFEAHPKVREAVAVVLAEDEARGLPAELAVSVVAGPDSPVTVRELRASAGARLPRALVPTRISVEAQLPRTPSGKADRAVLAGLFRRPRSGLTST
ncbi:AMP-binding protein [Streptomyces sp. JJ38]|uniref:AMP-binding protein n=1 Tax=Streptomyces sp. JJ38 TaxID=2738128 RepID=UPI001C588803|nr:AMP-binding protein [Streptomyces sp. JJ38]MBW1598370.1 AMP-binding protein [Streptomyces sp. JJ38]